MAANSFPERQIVFAKSLKMKSKPSKTKTENGFKGLTAVDSSNYSLWKAVNKPKNYNLFIRKNDDN